MKGDAVTIDPADLRFYLAICERCEESTWVDERLGFLTTCDTCGQYRKKAGEVRSFATMMEEDSDG